MPLFYPSRRALVDTDFVETLRNGGYSAPMSFPIRYAAVASALLGLCAAPAGTSGAATNLVFAAGRIACEISSPRGAVPPLVLSTLPIAMNAAVDAIGAPAESVRLSIRLLDPPPFYKRARALFRTEAFALQTGDEIRLQAGDDPLILAFRLAHELAHWLVYKKHPARPPLWLDEGLAQLVGANAADACARVHKQDLERPAPDKLSRNLLGLGELTALRAYPADTDRSAAFYWQSEALARAVLKRLGPADFAAYLGLLCVSAPPAWQEPLQERWYFSDWDVNWLARQIMPAEDRKP